jgi:uncharacterized protein YndB with AHSA1/START domain
MWRWVAVAVGVLVVAFLCIGVVKPSVSVSLSTLVNRSPEVVWKVFTDASRAKEWMTGLMSMETVSGTRMTVGSRHKLVFLENDRRVEMEETLTAIEPGKLYAFDFSLKEATGSTTVRLTPKDGATQLTFEGDFRGRSMLWRSLMVILQSMVDKRQSEDMEKLKTLAEAEPAG